MNRQSQNLQGNYRPSSNGEKFISQKNGENIRSEINNYQDED
jgi:hypothetical protein